ncbi:MAG: SDR family oxidoreductase [Rhizobiaceae bacterium]|nr:SDR family oxidoreductase [Rhizobiaceae bacterium]
MQSDFKDKVVVISGSGRGIGATAAAAFAQRGAKVGVWDLEIDRAQSVVEQIREAGGEAIAVSGSVGSSEAVNSAIREIARAFGTIHVLINNAGYGNDASVVEMTDAQWDDVINVCLTSQFYCARAAAPYMIKQRYGRIVNISSRTHMGEFNKSNYCAAKAGVLGFTRALAFELGEYNITANAIAPGIVRTERVLAQSAYAGLSERARERQLIKRDAVTDDIVNGMLFFAAESSGFVTADMLHITGGRMS